MLMHKIFWYIIIGFFLFPLKVFSQISAYSGMGMRDILEEEVLYYATDSDLTFDQIIQEKSFQPLGNKEDYTDLNNLWLQFEVINRDSLPKPYYFRSNVSHITLYQKSAEGKWEELVAGAMTPLKLRTDRDEYPWVVKTEIDSQTAIEFYIHLEKSRYGIKFFNLFMGDQLAYYDYYYHYEKYIENTEIFSAVYVAGLTMVFIFILMMYLLVKDTVYLYYLLYLFFQIIYSLISFSGHPLRWINLSRYYLSLNFLWVEAVQFMFIGFYILFILKLLEIGKTDWLGKTMLIAAYLSFAYAVFSLVFLYFNYSSENLGTMFIISRSIALPANLMFIIAILVKVRHPLIFYFAVAHMFFFFGAILSVWIFLKGKTTDPYSVFFFKNSPDTIFQAGLLGEVICFSLALAYRVRIIQNEKRESIRAYIHQLKKNKAIQEEMNRELDRMIHHKTEELIQVYSEIERRRARELKLEFEQKLNKLENIALRSQMNPHFLFNSMNAIKHLIVKGKTEKASNYLDDFSILLRGILLNSKKETVSVAEELRMLELYLKMEKARLGRSFDFEIENGDLPELEMYAIPVLLLQPIVENAIWHGLQPSLREEKKVRVSCKLENDLIIEIKDNGIGREASLKNKEENKPLHQSIGLEIVRDRLALYNHSRDLKINFKIEDLKKDGQASGTLVTFIYSNGAI